MSNNCVDIRILNRTRWTITGEYRPRKGSGFTVVPMLPGAASGNMTAWKAEATGAEGALTLHLTGVGLETADTSATDIVIECGSPHGHTNYWRPIQVSPFVQLSPRFGVGGSALDPHWGTPPPLYDAASLGVLLTITEQLPVYVRIVNKTKWAIAGTYIGGDIAGGALPVKVAPHSVSEVVTDVLSANTAPLHDLHLEGLPAENMDDTRITFMPPNGVAELPSGWQLGPAISPFARIDARFGLGQPTGADNWGSTHFPRFDERIGMEPLGMQVTITEQTPVQRLSVLTYNTHLFQGSPADVIPNWVQETRESWLLPWLQEVLRDVVYSIPTALRTRVPTQKIWNGIKDRINKLNVRVVYEDDERQNAFIAKLNELDKLGRSPDIVSLQEVWDDRRKERLLEALREIYPYAYIPPNDGYPVKDLWGWVWNTIRHEVESEFSLPMFGNVRSAITTHARDGIRTMMDTIPGDIGDWSQSGDMNKVTNSSGLMVLSKFPILETTFHVYEGATKFDDQLAKKGALTVRIRVPRTAVEAFDVRIGTTHAYTPTLGALQNIQKLAEQTLGQPPETKSDALLLGDFNLSERAARYLYPGPETKSSAPAEIWEGDLPGLKPGSPEYIAFTAPTHREEKKYVRDGEVSREYVELVAALDKLGFREVVEDESQGVKPGNYETYYTDWNGGVNLSHLMEGVALVRDPNKRDRIDYVFLRPGDKGHLRSVGPSGVRVFHEWTYTNKDEEVVEVSDHMPVLVEFNVVPSVTETKPSVSQAETAPAPQPVG